MAQKHPQSPSDVELHDEALRLAGEIVEHETELKRWMTANPQGSAGGLVGVIIDKKKRVEAIIQHLRESGFLTTSEQT
jgi:hypothetical protein